jgi:hypothetical protein
LHVTGLLLPQWWGLGGWIEGRELIRYESKR